MEVWKLGTPSPLLDHGFWGVKDGGPQLISRDHPRRGVKNWSPKDSRGQPTRIPHGWPWVPQDLGTRTFLGHPGKNISRYGLPKPTKATLSPKSQEPLRPTKFVGFPWNWLNPPLVWWNKEDQVVGPNRRYTKSKNRG